MFRAALSGAKDLLINTAKPLQCNHSRRETATIAL